MRGLLQPSLLDRLIDYEPEKETEAANAYTLTNKQLKEIILRDLTWLLNTTQLQAVKDLEAFPEVQRSVVNYGVPDLAGRPFSNIDAHKLEVQITLMIKYFEPRIIPESLNITIHRESDARENNVIEFVIEGQIWCEPTPIEVLLKSQINLEDGNCTISEFTR